MTPFMDSPVARTAVMADTEMSAHIRPYSIAVAPLLLEANFFRRCMDFSEREILEISVGDFYNLDQENL